MDIESIFWKSTFFKGLYNKIEVINSPFNSRSWNLDYDQKTAEYDAGDKIQSMCTC